MDLASARRLAIIYLRLSDAPDDEGTFDKREARVRSFAESRGFEVLKVVLENNEMPGDGEKKNASAFKRKKIKLPGGRVKLRVIRPGFRSILDDLASGRADAIFAEDLDRVMRDPRDLEDLIDVCGYYNRSAFSVTGTLTLTDGGTDSEITMARVMVTIANKSSRDTARRVAAGRQRIAPSGKWGGGARPYGFLPDGITVLEEEADQIRQWAKAILADASLKSIAQHLREQGKATPRSKAWTARTVRDILLRPRNAGIFVYRPAAVHRSPDNGDRNRYLPEERVGVAPGDPILPEDTWEAVVNKLLDPNRVTTPGTAPKWLGSGVYRCVCGEFMRVVNKGAGRVPRYRCGGQAGGPGHAMRRMEDVDNLVVEALVEMLSRPGAVDLFVKPSDPSVDLNVIRAEIKTLRDRENVFADDYATGLIPRSAMLAGMDRIKAEIGRREGVLKENTAVSPLAPLVGASDVQAVWKEMSLGLQQEALRSLFTVTILPSGRGNLGFDPRFVRIERLEKGADH